jgi:hypothetical protein
MNSILPTNSIGGFVNPISLSATAGVPAGTTVSFSPNPVTPGSSTTVSLNNANTLAAGTYSITVTGTATGATTQVTNITFNINPGSGPAITTQPANQTVCTGANTSFAVTAPSATTYQWQLSIDGGTTFTNISNGGVYTNVTTATLNLTGVTAGMNNYRYRCIASALCGSTASAAAILTVNTAPAVTTHPQDVLLCAGSNHTFSVTATGSGLSYQWQLSTDGGATYNNIAGANTASYSLTGITAGMNGNRYRCVVSGTCTPAANSNGAVLTVVTSVTVTTQPVNSTVCAGTNTSFTVAGSGSGIIYQWQVNTGGGFNDITNGGVYSGANTATLNLTGVTTGMNGYQYRCMLSNATCTTPGTSSTATLSVNSLPAVSANPQNATICEGGNTTFSVTASGTSISYQWQLSADGGATFNNIAGANTASYTVSSVTTTMNGNRYRCVVNGTCSPAVTSTSALLTVVAPATVTSQPSNAERCSGSDATFNVTGSGAGIIYQWQVSTNGGASWTNISGAANASLTVSAVATSMNNYQYRCLLSNATCTSPVTSAAAILTVRQLPSVSLSAAPLTSLLPGQTTTLTAVPSASTGGTLTTTWYMNGAVFSNTTNNYVVTVETTGAYQVRIQEVFAGGLTCSNQSAVVTIDATVSNKLFIFPSPNDGNFTVSYYNNGGTSTQRSISIFDSKGARVFSGQFPVTGPYTLIPINLQKANTGIYYVVIGDATGKKLAEGKVHIH